MWLPIWVDGKANTCLEICRSTAYPRRVLDELEGMVGVYRNFQSLLDYSERDSLTGLLNRKTFERHFARAKSHCLEADSQFDRRRVAKSADKSRYEWLAVVDIDHFKKVNDNFGHLYGDEVLILVANLMQASFRKEDKVFRFGGEEFVVLLHAVTLEDAHKVFERFRQKVESNVFPQVGKITVSIGYTYFHPKEAPVEVLGHADQALYFAKSHGRNRCCQYEDLVANGQLLPADTRPDAAIDYF